MSKVLLEQLRFVHCESISLTDLAHSGSLGHLSCAVASIVHTSEKVPVQREICFKNAALRKILLVGSYAGTAAPVLLSLIDQR